MHEPVMAEAWGLKEAFRSVYRASSRDEAERRLDHFLAAVERAQIPSFNAFADGVRPWRSELLAYFDEPKIANMKAHFTDYWVDKPVLVFASNA